MKKTDMQLLEAFRFYLNDLANSADKFADDKSFSPISQRNFRIRSDTYLDCIQAFDYFIGSLSVCEYECTEEALYSSEGSEDTENPKPKTDETNH